MKFSQFAGYSVMPVFARVVLFLAFLPAGFHKVFHTQTFEGPQAQVLRDLGIGEDAPLAHAGPVNGVRLASWQDDGAPADPPAGDSEEPSSVDLEKTESDTPDWVDDAQRIASGEAEPPAGPVKARSLHSITTMLVHGGMSPQWRPQYMAWMAALTELLGGALIFVGLFSRIWGLGLAIAMGFAFYVTSLQGLTGSEEYGPIKMIFNWATGVDGYAPFHMMVAQLALLVLALGIFLTGPGALSADRIFFSGEDPEQGLDDLDDED